MYDAESGDISLALVGDCLLTRRLRVERPLVPLAAIVVAALIYEVILALLTQPGAIEWRSYAQVVILPAILTALVPTLPLFFLLRRVLRGQL